LGHEFDQTTYMPAARNMLNKLAANFSCAKTPGLRPSRSAAANAEHKFRDPYGIVFDISTHGWDGAER
jgi:hypothetical protein